MPSRTRKTSRTIPRHSGPRPAKRQQRKSIVKKSKIRTQPRTVAVKQAPLAAAKRAQGSRKKVVRQVLAPKVSSSSGPLVATERAKLAKVNAVRTASIKHYEAAVKLLYSHHYEKAKAAFEKIIAAFADDKDVLERTRLHLRLCEQKIAHKPLAPRTLDDHYNLAVALMNEGRYDESQDHLQKALKSNPRCDYVFYALAANSCRQGNLESALGHLQTAISLKPENRFLAQRDSDFEILKEDSRFVSLVFPERAPVPTH